MVLVVLISELKLSKNAINLICYNNFLKKFINFLIFQQMGIPYEGFSLYALCSGGATYL